MSSERRKRQPRPRNREWTPDDHWPRDEGAPQDPGWRDDRGGPQGGIGGEGRPQGGNPDWPQDRDGDWPQDGAGDWPQDGGRDWPPGDGPARGRTLRIVLSVAASAMVVLALGAYGIARLDHKTSINARQDSATAPCPQRASTGQGSTGQGSSSQQGAGCGTAAPAGAGAAAGSSAAPGSSVTPGKSRTSHSATPTPTPTASRHSHAPAPPPAPTPKPSPTKSSGAPGGTSSASAAAQVLSLINQARAQAGLPAYTISSGLDTSSRRHTMVMARGCGLSHQCQGEAALGDRLTAAGVHWTSAGENIGEGGPEPDSSSAIANMAVGLTQDMLNEKPPDDGHRLNILSSSFHHVGIYVFRDSHGTVWMTQDFSN